MMESCGRILPCPDCPALIRRLKRRDYYLEEPNAGEITEDTFDVAFKNTWNITFATFSTEVLEEEARKRGCGGKVIELVEGVEFGETCPVQTAMSNELIDRQGHGTTGQE